jgi:flagellar biosynthesis activator protein FlaF
MFSTPKGSYETNQKATDSGRDLEAAALFKAARMLEAARERSERGSAARQLQDALRHNLRLWTLFQAELARPDHGLPVDLRADLLRLSTFIDRRTFELMTSPAPDKVQALIDINRHIALGLAGTGQQNGGSQPEEGQVSTPTDRE